MCPKLTAHPLNLLFSQGSPILTGYKLVRDPKSLRLKQGKWTSLEVQWLRIHLAGDLGSIPGQGAKLLHARRQLNPHTTTRKPVCRNLSSSAAKNKYLKGKKKKKDPMLPMQKSRFQFPVRELRFCMPHSMARKTKQDRSGFLSHVTVLMDAAQEWYRSCAW